MYHPTILLVDDDLDDRYIFQRALQEADPDALLREAGDGVSAWQLLHDEGAAAPDYIFMDINMPQMSGMECLGRIRALSAVSCPVIICSTSQSLDDRTLARDLGAYAFFTKPHSYDSLVRGISLLLDPSPRHGPHLNGLLEVF